MAGELAYEFVIRKSGRMTVAELVADSEVIVTARDGFDVMADANYQGANAVIFHAHNLGPDFLALRSGMAGEIMQKFANYQMKLAIIGDWSAVESNSLQALIRECNRGNQFFFAGSVEEALARLSR